MSKDSYGDGNVYRGQRSKDSAVKTITWERSIETFSDEQLLFELVRRNGFQRAAKATEEANAKANASWTLMCKKMVAIEREAIIQIIKETPFSNWFQADVIEAIRARGEQA